MNFYQNHENWNFIKSNKMGRGVGVVAVGKWIGGKNLAIKPSKMEKNFHENSPQALRLIKDNFILHKSIIFDIHEWWRIILFFSTTKSYLPDSYPRIKKTKPRKIELKPTNKFLIFWAILVSVREVCRYFINLL